MSYVIGSIAKHEIEDFRKECEKLGWTIISVTDTELKYLDRKMNSRTLDITEDTTKIVAVIGGR